jgi:hypothetical protein
MGKEKSLQVDCPCQSKTFRVWFSFRDSYGDEYFMPVLNSERCSLCGKTIQAKALKDARR